MRTSARRLAWSTAAATVFAALAGCSGGGGSSGSGAPSACDASCASAPFLATADVERILAQAGFEAQARGKPAHIAVVDRSGNVLAVFSMPGAPATIAITSGLGVAGGLDGIAQGTVPATLAAIAKAITGTDLSSQGHAFSTRTAGQIVQEHFNPGELGETAGPLYGVQFSQLSCSDVTRQASEGTIGPQRSPLGLAADPGGLPLYKDGVLVGGVGIEADGVYSFDRDIGDVDEDGEEAIAVAAGSGFAAPDDIRAGRITVAGRGLRYVDDASLRSDPARAPPLDAIAGALVAVEGYTGASIRAGVAYGTPASGIRRDDGALAAAGAWILVDGANANRYPPRAAAGAAAGDLTADEVRTILSQALAVAGHARAQIRRPLGATAQVTIAVVDLQGNVLGLVRTSDGALFGIDVAVQKARTATFFSHPAAATAMAGFLPAHELAGPPEVSLARYLDDAREFLGADAFTGRVAWSSRAIGNLHRPFFPDGIDGTAPGPFSTPIERWSPFNVGLQLDLDYNQLVKAILGDASRGCASRAAAPGAGDDGFAPLANGLQIFPGGLPIYRGTRLVGGIGVSGDGVDQDDMVAFLALANAQRALGGALGNAPAAMRADQLTPRDVRLRYVQCPQAPFVDTADENACAGL
ncbi:MAG TPA: heme-binding protein [Casimicrobiaceae bacterium]|nr:heme-binding protein [Casimicrobiaceae bacterium]